MKSARAVRRVLDMVVVPPTLLNLISKLAPQLGDLAEHFPGCLISRGVGQGVGFFGLAATFFCFRYHASKNGWCAPKDRWPEKYCGTVSAAVLRERL